MMGPRKYVEVARVTARSQAAYLGSEALGASGALVILFIYAQLWRTTYSVAGQGGLIAGYSEAELLWYLAAAEAIVLSLPPIHAVIEAEVRHGDVAIRLGQPYSYLLFHYSAFVGLGLLRFAVTLAVGGALIWVLVGPPPQALSGAPALLALLASTQALHFCYGASIGLAAFWVEDVSGLFFLFDRLKWLLGGFLLPIELYPAAIRPLVDALPFRHMIAGPARLFVKFEWAAAAELALSQALWLGILGLLCRALYRAGVRRVDVHGG